MTIQYHPALVQGSEEWRAARCGLLTASEMERIITPAKLQHANNKDSRGHLYELLAQRITQYVEPSYISDDMLRGKDDEIDARVLYAKHFGSVEPMGFVTNDKWGFTLGYSPDWLIGNDGQAEVKGRRQKYGIETIIANEMPAEFMIQVQTGLLVSERKWCDFLSFCGGLHMLVLRVYPDAKVHEAIIDAADQFHDKLELLMNSYLERLADKSNRLVPTVRRVELEITV